MSRHKTVAIASQRASFGIVQWTADTCNGKTDRRTLGSKLKRMGATLRKEYADGERIVSEWTLPVGQHTQHGLQEWVNSLKAKRRTKERKPTYVKAFVAAPGRGSAPALGDGQTKKPGSHRNQA